MKHVKLMIINETKSGTLRIATHTKYALRITYCLSVCQILKDPRVHKCMIHTLPLLLYYIKHVILKSAHISVKTLPLTLGGLIICVIIRLERCFFIKVRAGYMAKENLATKYDSSLFRDIISPVHQLYDQIMWNNNIPFFCFV